LVIPAGPRRVGFLVLAAGGLTVLLLGACSPIYVIRAGIAEAKILAARRPIAEVVNDPGTTEEARGKLALVLEARSFAAGPLALDVGDSYTSFTQLEKDTLAMVLSAAYRDRLAAKTWWFPIVGRVPYRGYFSLDDALDAQQDLERDGLDTYLRPTAAFSTLGWFADPLLSTLLRYDHVQLVTSVLHELSHNHLFVSGRVQFNESFATFVGQVGAVEFFCRRDGGGPDTAWCRRAQASWRDAQRFGRFMDALVNELQTIYADPDLTLGEKLARRDEVFEDFRNRFVRDVQPTFEAATYGGFLATPLNNATLLSRMLYYHRLADFDRTYVEHGEDLRATVDYLARGVDGVDDPFDLLETAPAPR
jgi:predicted aminopeptidase